MSKPHLTEDQVTLAYFGEAPADMTRHLSTCPECSERLQSLARLLDAIRETPVPAPEDSFTARVWTAIAPRVKTTLKRRSRPRWPLWTIAPALAAVLAIVFVAGMLTQRHLQPPSSSFPARARERVLLISLGEHLDRAQIVLAELEHSPEGTQTDIATEQQLAVKLVADNRLLRQAVSRSGDRSDAVVLDELERVLLEVAHSPDEISSADLNRIRDRIESQDLLFKVRVTRDNVHEKGMRL